jgi:hypothetical protein
LDLVARLKAIFGPPAERLPEKIVLPVVERCPVRRRTLRCDLLLTLGPASIPIFPRGPIEEFQFFQRFGIAPDHEVEFMTRLDADDADTENYGAYGIFALKGPHRRLPDLRRDRGLARRLEHKYGLGRLPHAAKMAPPSFGPGLNRLRPPTSTKPLRKANGRSWFFSDLLEILRIELTGPQKIAWIEEAIPPPPPHSPIVHRYYLDGNKQAYLVRDHRGVGKRLYVARTSEQAVEPCLLSTRAHARRAL